MEPLLKAQARSHGPTPWKPDADGRGNQDAKQAFYGGSNPNPPLRVGVSISADCLDEAGGSGAREISPTLGAAQQPDSSARAGSLDAAGRVQRCSRC